MLNSPFGGYAIPEDEDADNIPAWATLLIEDLDVQTVLRATNATDRDTKYVQCPASVVVVSTTNQTIWIKVSDPGTNDWETVFEKPDTTPYWSTGHSFGTDWSNLSVSQTQYGSLAFHYDRFRDMVSIRGGAIKSTNWTGGGEQFVRLPSGLEPVNTQGFVAFAVYSHGTANCEVRADGWLYLWGWADSSYSGVLDVGQAGTGIALDGFEYRMGVLG